MAGEYGYGRELNVDHMTFPSSTEDGPFIPPSAQLSFKRYTPEAVEFGARDMPLNLYGDKDDYKPFDPTGPSRDDILDALKR
jgi:hypothetical protein